MVCQDCPTGVMCPDAGAMLATMELQEHQFRISEHTAVIRDCPGPGCRGGAIPGQYCRPGYQGALCAVCEVDYYKTADGCTSCSGHSSRDLMLWLAFFLCVVIVVWLVRRYFASAFEYVWSTLRVHLRITWSTLQIMSQFPSLLSAIIPPSLVTVCNLRACGALVSHRARGALVSRREV